MVTDTEHRKRELQVGQTHIFKYKHPDDGKVYVLERTIPESPSRVLGELEEHLGRFYDAREPGVYQLVSGKAGEYVRVQPVEPELERRILNSWEE